MDYKNLKAYMLDKPESALDFPFGEDVSVFKVKGKMFALFGQHDGMAMLNLKCDPQEAVMLCDIFSGVKPGYHMDKRHWISIYDDGSVPNNEVLRLIDNSYRLVVSKMPKRDQRSILLHLDSLESRE